MTHDEIIAVVQAHKEGKKVERKVKEVDTAQWLECFAKHFNFSEYDYRVADDPKPPTLREWKPEEVPLDAWFREKPEHTAAFRITGVDTTRNAPKPIEVWNDLWLSPERLLKDYIHSFTPFDANSWKECGVRE